MTQEWAMPNGETEAFEREVEHRERQMTEALPGILDALTLDLFDQFAPDQDPDDFEIDAYRTAAANVIGNLKRLIAEDEATIAQIRQLQVVGSTPEGQTP